MQVTINIDNAAKITALSRATFAYNAANHVAFTDEQFLQFTTDQNLDALVAVHTKPTITKYDFLGRFTQEERIAIRSSAASNATLGDFMAMLEVSGEVQLRNPSTQSGVNFLEQVGLLSAGRAAEILSI